MSFSKTTSSSGAVHDLTSGERRFVWDSSISRMEKSDTRLSQRVFGNDGVVTILRKAFAMGLPRSTAWDISNTPVDIRDSMVAAARVYKRGVTICDSSDSSRRRSILQNIDFNDDVSSCFSQLSQRDIILVDENVAQFWWHRLPAGFTVFNFSEATKNLNVVADLLDLLRSKAVENSVVHVVGGGVAGDVTGFSAGIIGLPYRFVPTTLLAMVDSSIGGKVGVNFEPWGKNQVGLFHAPQSVSICTSWLSTLPERELRSGLVEALKHALLSGREELWHNLIQVSRDGNWSKLGAYLPEIISFKKDVVARDPFETSERAILNFGHTLGHALETLSYSHGHIVTHGECVALGIVHALRLSEKYMGMAAMSYLKDIFSCGVILPSERLKDIFGDLKSFSESRDLLMRLLSGDKKSTASESVSFVLLRNFGDVARAEDGGWTIKIPLEQAWLDILDTWRFLALQDS